MSANTGEFLTIAGRWKHAAKVSGMDKLPRGEQALAMMMFYAGFSASLEAGIELANIDERAAVGILQALHREVETVSAMADKVFSGAEPS